MPEPATTRETPWSVATASTKIRDYIDRLGTIWVEGEITQWGLSAGNVYGKLKDCDVDATVSFTIWSSVHRRLAEKFAQGDRVVALMKPNWWVKGGTLTMQVYDLRHVGIGDLLERIERLRAQLGREGLFAAERKRRLPFLPGVVGLVTARDSDAEQDVLRNARLRWPAVEFRTAYASVQGDRAVPEVVAAIERLDADPEVEVIIVARGGGDFQNLLAFSDERVVRAAAAARTPIVSAIGHEADRPLLDEVADLRASTPTDAAKRVVPDVAEELARVEQVRSRLGMRMTSLLTREVDRIEHLRSRPSLADTGWLVERRGEEITRWVARGADLVERTVERHAARTAELRAQLRALSPQSTLDRGYAIVQGADGHVLKTPADAPAGASLMLTLAQGRLAAESRGPGGETGTRRRDADPANRPGPGE